MGRGEGLGVAGDLDDAGAVAQIDEDERAMITAAASPATIQTTWRKKK